MSNRFLQSFRAAPWASSLTILLLLAGTAQLLTCAWSLRNSTSPDYATVVLMAKHMAEGKDFPVFFYGQAYMGSFEPAVSALLCTIFGFSSFCVCLGTVLFGIALLSLTAWTGRKLAGPWGGALSLLFLTTAGYTWHVFMSSPHGGYALCSLLTLGALAIPVFASYPEHGSKERLPLLPTAAFGLLAGLAFWNTWLAAPAFVIGGGMLLFRLRWRIFSPRFFAIGILFFLLGSLPLWIWMINNGSEPLALKASDLSPPGFVGLLSVLTREIPRYWGATADIPAFWHGPVPWLDVAAIAIGAAALALQRTSAMRRFAGVSISFLVFFHFVYALSSFGGIDTARYLVPLSAPCTILAGAGVAAILEGTSSSRRNRIFRTTAGAALLASRLGVVAPMAFGAFSQRIFPANKKGLAAVETWRTVATDPELKGRPGYAEFTDFSANWMSDEALCLVSAKRWRYHPYLERLEACDNPWICGRYSAVEDFIRSSGGSCRVRSVHGVRIVDEIQPPAPVEELPWDPSWVVRDEEGRDVEVSLYDDDWSSEVNLSSDEESHCHVDIELPEPNRIVGIEALVDGILSARFWKIEEVQPDGRLVPLGKAAAMQGWFWSGPRLYQFGPGTRWEMRWPARAVSHIRISFVARAPSYSVCLHGIHLLSEEVLPDRNLEAVCTAVQEFREKEGEGLRIHADRWLGGKIGAAPDPALKAGYGSGNIDSEPSFSYSNVDFSRPSLAVVRLGEPDRRAERVLDRAGAVFERSEAGGYALFRIPEQASTNARLKEYLSKGIVRFLCGNLWLETQVGKPSERDAPAIATLGGGLFDLLVAEPKTKVARPGQTVPFRLDWRLGAGRNTLEPIHVFVHGMRDGKIAFQGQTLIFPEFVPGPRNLPRFSKDQLLLQLPSDLPAGEYDLRIRFCPGVYSKRRLSVETELPTRLRTITLPATLRVDPSAP